jgi:hypothetical protein
MSANKPKERKLVTKKIESMRSRKQSLPLIKLRNCPNLANMCGTAILKTKSVNLFKIIENV